MNVTKATVILQTNVADLVVLHLDDLPSPMPGITKEPLSVTFHAEFNKGEEYVKKYFPTVPVVVIPRCVQNHPITSG